MQTHRQRYNDIQTHNAITRAAQQLWHAGEISPSCLRGASAESPRKPRPYCTVIMLWLYYTVVILYCNVTSGNFVMEWSVCIVPLYE